MDAAQNKSRFNYWNGKEIISDKIALTQPILILVEGIDDLYFLKAFCDYKKLSNIGILNYQGKEKLPRTLSTLHVHPGYDQLSVIGITRDADDKIGAEVFKDVCEILENANYAEPSSFGKFTDGGISSPKVGVFVMPDENEKGELEDVLFKTISDDDYIKNCVSQYIKCVKNSGIELKKIAKARLYAWLACQNSSHPLHLSKAAGQGLFDFNHECLNALSQFLNDLSKNAV